MFKRCKFCDKTIWDRKVFKYKWLPGSPSSKKPVLLNCCRECKPAVDEAILNSKVNFFPVGAFRKGLEEVIIETEIKEGLPRKIELDKWLVAVEK